MLSPQQAVEIWRDYARRWSIECWFRFLKEEGLHIEDVQVRRLERPRRLVNIVLIAALFVLNRQFYLQLALLLALLELGGKLGIKADKDGPYLVLAGIRRLRETMVLLSSCQNYPLALPP